MKANVSSNQSVFPEEEWKILAFLETLETFELKHIFQGYF